MTETKAQISVEHKEIFFRKEINKILANQLRIFAIIAAISGLLALLFEVKYFYNYSFEVYIARLAALSIAFFALIAQNTKFGKKFPSFLIHTVILSVIFSFAFIIFKIPETLLFNSQVLSLLILTTALFLKWDSKNQIIVAIYYVLLFVGAILFQNMHNLNLAPSMIEAGVLVIFISLLSVAANSLNFRLRRTAFFRKFEIEESDKKYKDIFENSAEGIFRCTVEGNFLMLNPAMVKMAGYEVEDEFKSLNFFNDLLENPREAESLKKVINEQKILRNHRIQLKKKDESDIIVKANLRLTDEDSGMPAYIEASMQNITQQVIAENERQKALNELRKAKIQSDVAANKAKEEASFKTMYLANMSHEIRTPINAVIGALDIINNDMFQTREDLKEIVHSAKISADSMLEILNNILDLSKIEAGKLTLDEAEFDIREEINKALSIISSNAKEKNLGISYHIDDKLPRILVGDPIRYRQVLLNLLSNAIKYTDRGEILVSIRVAGVKDNQVKFVTSVRDTGKGIPEEKIRELFKPYSQIREKGDKRDGTGLGLVISQEFVKMMGGRFDVESKIGVGSRFRFSVVLKFVEESAKAEFNSSQSFTNESKKLGITLELEPDKENDIQVEDEKEYFASIEDDLRKNIENSSVEKFDNSKFENQKEPENKPVEPKAVKTSPKAGRDSNRKKLLLVEDNPISQQLEMKILTEIGYNVIPVSNGNEALKALENSMFDLILMDVEMPEMDGLTATKHIRENKEFSHIPIIAVTAHSSMKDREKCLAAGMDDYMAKPISVQFLRIIIDKWLKHGREEY